ncbi:MAG: type II toxin-antitoxin system RelE/ParE family toxin [Duncaniella sp.]|nr:type II toxin-antitoxin system RelE/ParE family toxin [Duncaniella sp.]MDE6429843.1 type II toxin-antitoxin system RelE/ParE family toxin [Duncaniella sp.]MDE6823278.1 type II toxin-antitoxin system RelE/ParE family toxin [Duncaniella sp.]
MEKPFFKFIALEEASRFIESLPPATQLKIYYNIDKVAGGVKDSELFKKLENTNIWEFRTIYQGCCYRLFAFWDKEEETFVIATHGIVKKTQKTPSKEIVKAESIRLKYFTEKHN